ncbi:hypothetical protein [Alteromonas sp. KUL49]|uniref:hypothetical protein n=1 Tax=Alteromonas sp. KUL49 TaxID=2480798 RepID=UPI00102EF600|nr:hypothetical protein [Alteromonas sp. KUL49]TAP36867.1 hypothetical protein EYS00_17270 [Alteromonas sp. KUL49]GEA13131.1 hypothetical protein KUL49_35060 [Alteromonas sp. KUL49]
MNSTFKVVAFSPLDIPLRLRTGLDPHSRQYKALQNALSELSNVQVAHSDLQQEALEQEENIQRQYKRLDVDVQAMHLCTFTFRTKITR